MTRLIVIACGVTLVAYALALGAVAYLASQIPEDWRL